MKLARYMGGGEIAILEEDAPPCPPGGLLVRTLASGLCSGELMDWYMDRKIPHVLGHEVCGEIIESEDSRFSVGARVAPHHHAPCMKCDLCRRGAHVHCEQWKRTKLIPGGMAEVFAVPAENLTDTILIDAKRDSMEAEGHALPRIRAQDGALIEPLACVSKSFWRAFGIVDMEGVTSPSVAVIGLGFMGVMHMLMHSRFERMAKDGLRLAGYDTNPRRIEWARNLGLNVDHPDSATKAEKVFVCPGSSDALRLALSIVEPNGTILLFSPLSPPGLMELPINDVYFNDVSIIPSYSCGPNDTKAALDVLLAGDVKAEQVVSDFISLDELPRAYKAMKAGEILKPMVMFD